MKHTCSAIKPLENISCQTQIKNPIESIIVNFETKQVFDQNGKLIGNLVNEHLGMYVEPINK